MVVKDKTSAKQDLATIVFGASVLFVLYASVAILTFVIGRIVIAIIWTVMVPVLFWWIAKIKEDEKKD